MYKNLDYSSPGFDPETYHSPQGQGQETPLTPIRVNITHSVTPGGGTKDIYRLPFFEGKLWLPAGLFDADPPLYNSVHSLVRVVTSRSGDNFRPLSAAVILACGATSAHFFRRQASIDYIQKKIQKN